MRCVISHHLRKYHEKYPELVQSVESSLYVDDLIAGEDTVEHTFNLYAKAKKFMADDNFNLRKWNSNLTELLAKIRMAEQQELKDHATPSPDSVLPHQDRLCDKSLVSVGGSNNVESKLSKLLGVTWNSDTDQFMFCFSELAYVNELPATRCSVLKVSAKIFDPLGLISPFVVRLKILFQTLCIEG